MSVSTPISTSTRRRHLARVCWLVLCGLGAAGSARAAGAKGTLDWDAPESCPGALEVYARLSSLLGYEPEALGKLSRVRGSIVRTSSGFRLVLESFEAGRRSSRGFEAASCEDLADAAALAIALAVAPPSTVVAEPTSAPSAAVERLPVAPPSDAAAVPAAAAPGGAESERARGFAGASAVVEYGALPGPAPGVAIDAGVRLRGAALGAYGVLFGSQLQKVAPAQSVQFALWLAGARGCYPLLERGIELQACAGLEAGRFAAQGLGLEPVRSSNDLWLAVGGALAARWPRTGSVAVELRGEPMLPLMRKEYTVNGSEGVHAPSSLSLRLYLGLTLLGG